MLRYQEKTAPVEASASPDTWHLTPDTCAEAYLGIDIGSVSTNLVVIDAEGNLLKEIYLRTQGRPIEVVDRGLKEIEAELGESLDIRGVGTTGSGRELIGELVGADTVNDEITAHKTGSMHVCNQHGHGSRGHDFRNRRAGFQVHPHRQGRGGGLHHERGLRRGHRLLPGRAGGEAGDLHQGGIRAAGAGVRQARRAWASAARCSWSATSPA